VLVHGSGGVYNALLDCWPKAFNAAVVAGFKLDMFGPRGVQSTAEDQSLVPFPADDCTPIAPCQDYPEKIGKAGTPVEFVVLEGAQHKFDSDDLKRYYLRGATRT
jgi:hypothetical protein